MDILEKKVSALWGRYRYQYRYPKKGQYWPISMLRQCGTSLINSPENPGILTWDIVLPNEQYEKSLRGSATISTRVLGNKRTGKKRTENKRTGKKRTGKKRNRKREHAEKSALGKERTRKKAHLEKNGDTIILTYHTFDYCRISVSYNF